MRTMRMMPHSRLDANKRVCEQRAGVHQVCCHVLLHLCDACTDLVVSLHQSLPGLLGRSMVVLCADERLRLVCHL